MILRAFFIACVLVFVLAPNANADPISIAILGALGIAASATAVAVTTAVLTAIVGGIISTGLGLAASAIFGKKTAGGNIRPIAQRSRDVIDNVVGTVEYIPVVYGESKVGGLKAYAEVENSELFQVVVFSEGECQSLESWEIDGVASNDPKFSGLFTGWTNLGSDNQTHISAFTADAPGWTDQHRGRGICYSAFKFSKDSDVFPRIPVITAIIKGQKVFDPRTGLTAWSDNPALCILDYLLNTRYGKGLPEDELDLDSFTDAANYFDQLVNGLKRYTLNGFVITSQTILENLDEMLTSCNSILTFYNGKHRLKPMKPETAVFTFDRDNMIGPLNIERLGKRDKKNQADVAWMNPNNNWQGDLTIIKNDSFFVADGQKSRVLTLELPFTTVHQESDHIGQIAVNQSRLDTKVSFKATQAALQVEIGEVVKLTHPTPRWVEKLFRVNALGLEPDGNITVTLEEYDVDVYSLVALTIDQLGTQATFQSPFVIEAPGVPLVSQLFVTNTVGDIHNVVVMTWTKPVSGFVSEYQVEYKLTADTEWVIHGRTQNLFIDIIDLVPGQYYFRVKAINTVSASSAYSVALAEVVHDTDVPSDVINFQVVSTGGALLSTWEPESMAFGGGSYVIKHSPKITGATWNDPVNFQVNVSGREKKVVLGLIEGTYMIKAVNLAGIQSANPATIIVNLPVSQEFALIETVIEDPSFSGTKTGMVVTSEGKLTLDGSTDYDDKTGQYEDDTTTLFDDGGGRVLLGQYDFANETALPGNFFLRLVKDFTANYLDTNALYDDRDGLFDPQPGFFDGEDSNTVDVFLEYRSREDDLQAWTVWQPLNVNDIIAEDVQYRLIVTSDFLFQNIEFETLRVKVYLKRTNRGNANESIAVNGTTINFSPSFYSSPVAVASIVDIAQGDYATITNVTRSSFKITCYDKNDVSVTRTVNWQAYGIGEEII